jgi:hypothetical protein
MKRLLIQTGIVAASLSIVLFSCTKKDSTGISPGYGTTGNPNPNPTVTGSTTYTNPATENTDLPIGGAGWSNPSCGTTNSLSLKGVNGNVEVVLSFSPALTTAGSYTFNIATAFSPNSCLMSVLNAPNQPSGVIWYGKSGTAVINVTANSISGQISGGVCTQQTFNFPVVTVNGILSCSP